jgi:hypothetical protein
MKPVIAENTRKQHQDPEFIAKLHNDETQETRRQTMKKRLSENPAHLAAMQAGTKTPQAKENYSNAMKLAWSDNRENLLKNNHFVNGENPMSNPEIAERVRLSVIAHCAKSEVKAKKSAAISGDKNPMRNQKNIEKAKESSRKTYEANPLAVAKIKITFNGAVYSTRQACFKAGLSDSAIHKFAKRKGISTQEAFDLTLAKSSDERKIDSLRESKGIIFLGELLLKNEICQKYSINFFTVNDRSRRDGISFQDAAMMYIKKAA